MGAWLRALCGAPVVFLGGWDVVLGGNRVVDYVRDHEYCATAASPLQSPSLTLTLPGTRVTQINQLSVARLS